MTNQSSDQLTPQQQRKNMDKGRKKKGLGDGCSVDLGGSMCKWEILFRVKQTTAHEPWQLFKNAVRPMWWLRALGCAKMMVNERLVPSRFEILDSLQTRVRKKYQEELPTLNMLICANRRSSFTLNLFSQKHQGDQIRASLRVNMTYSHMFRKIRIATCAK